MGGGGPITAVGVDVGGTYTRVAAVDQAAQIVGLRQGTTDLAVGPEAYLDTLLGMIAQVREDAEHAKQTKKCLAEFKEQENV